ncbi:hypothetical protein B9Z65_2165 [Elsinoe australis]|uniref:Vesicle-mediated transport protein Vid24 n=1 Tax=Elsinoe australis TaxID=40998 RepID=A0A2P7YN72_9PEZI|nr:hypothetical protein B9Z65_2165 [Elsinoe australis]
MPSTPGEGNDGTVVVSLPVALPNPHATCPPEEDRQSHADEEEPAPEGERNGIMEPTRRPSLHDAENESGTESDGPEIPAKRMDEIDNVLLRDTPSPNVGIEDGRDHEARLAQSMSATALSPQIPQEWPSPAESPERVLPNSTSSYLQPGSKFVGTQQSDRQVYNVQVEIKYVDMEESFLCGYLRIQGLTDDHPTLTTYFEGEIIGNKHTFKTSHPEWGSSEKVDMQHWNRFPAWRPLAKQAKSPTFTFKNYAQREHLFMRWKEYFLVPDHKVKTITGASFEGFYYICFNQCSGSVNGIYFHAKSEKYQKLELEHVNDRGCSTAMEFR